MADSGSGNYQRVEEARKITEPEDAISVLTKWLDGADQEMVCVVTLGGAHQVISIRVVTVGTANTCLAHPREIFRGAIVDGAVAIIVAHNHPSGNPTPSSEDVAVAKKLEEVGKLLDIKLLDSIIITRDGGKSLKSEGYF